MDRNSKNAVDTTKSVHLSASAGSGKTRALKDRYLALLNVLDAHGLNFDQAVAITFTDKAAAEIKERVMQGLSEDALKKIIRGKQDLRISTIHSFCMNLLKRYPLDAGLPPDFGVLDTRDQAYKIQMAIEDALESDRSHELRGPLKSYTIDELASTIEFLLSIRNRLKRMEIDAGGPEGLIQSIRSGMEIDTTEADSKTLITGAEWRTSFRQMERLLRTQGDNYTDCMGPAHLLLAGIQDADVAFRTASAIAPVYFTLEGAPRKNVRITAKCFTGNNRREYETLFFNIQTLLYRFRNAYQRARAGRVTIGMLRLFQQAEERYQASKLREGLLDFDDLEIYAYRLLRSPESPDILYWLDRKILHFLVDEFQDTSDIQWAVLDKLTEEIFSGQGADKRMPPTLFVVGDEKQSIYRFREANYRLMENVREKMERNLLPESRELLTLDMNFRSTPEVIGTVNRVFAGLWGERYKPSEADRKGHKGSVSLIEIVPSPSQEESAGITEADMLAQEIKNVVDRRTAIYEKTENGWLERPAGYGDCAILIQSRTKLKEYEVALQKEGVPFRVVGGIGFYEENEIQAVMSALFFLWNKDDKLSLAAALKSPLFGLTDKDIFDLMQSEGSLVDALKQRRPECGTLLHEWESIAGLVPLSHLIHRIINDTGAYIRFGRLNTQAIFNLDKLLDTAREFDRRGYTTLQDFVEWVKNIRRTEQREAAADMNLPGFQGSVSIMTVHKAKGLEYPVVFLPGMNQYARSLSFGPGALIEETDGMRRMAIKDPDNPEYEDLWKGENGEQEERRREHQRLLYVAMTRARDHLVMLGARTNGKVPVKPDTWFDYLRRTIPFQQPERETGPRIMRYSYPDWQAQDITRGKETARQSRTAEERGNEVDISRVLENISPLPRSDRPEWKRATDYIERGKETELERPLPLTAANTVSSLTRGSVLHRCLEEYTKNGEYHIERIVSEFPDVLSLGDDDRRKFFDDVGSVLNSVLSNKDLAWIFERGAGAYSELPFLLKKGHALISGMIDRVVIKGDKGYVVDYKAILIENEKSLADWKDHYRPQIQIYCEAVKDIFRPRSVEGSLLFLDSVLLELTTKV